MQVRFTHLPFSSPLSLSVHGMSGEGSSAAAAAPACFNPRLGSWRGTRALLCAVRWLVVDHALMAVGVAKQVAAVTARNYVRWLRLFVLWSIIITNASLVVLTAQVAITAD